MRETAGGGRDEAIWSRELGRGSRRASIAIGTAMLVAMVSLAGLAFDFSLNAGKSQYYQVKAHFPTVNGIIEGSDVFFGGVRVGTVSDLAVDEDSHGATITLNIERPYAPMHEGAKVAVRPKSLLGEKYIAATVGDPSKPAICEGCMLPDSATAVNVELDELINILDEPTRKELQQLISNLGTGLAGQGPNTNQLFQTGQTNLDDLSKVTAVLQARDAQLKRIIEALNRLTQTLATDQQRTTYVNLLKHSDQVLKTLKAEDAQIQQSLDRTNAFFNELDQGLSPQASNIQGVFRALPTTVTNLDALSVALGRQGNIGYSAIHAAGAGTLEGPLIFGSQPDQTIYTKDVFTRVQPSQGCFAVHSRVTDGNGLQQNDLTTNSRPSAQDPTSICTLPGTGFLSCTTTLTTSPPECTAAIIQSLCQLHVFPTVLTDPVCKAAKPASAQSQHAATAAPQVAPQAPGAPQGASPIIPQLPIDPNSLNGLLGYLLKR